MREEERLVEWKGFAFHREIHCFRNACLESEKDKQTNLIINKQLKRENKSGFSLSKSHGRLTRSDDALEQFDESTQKWQPNQKQIG